MLKIVLVFRDVSSYLQWRAEFSGTVGHMASLGALHDGHAQNIRTIASSHDACVVSLMLNPLQFNDHIDLEKYVIDGDSDLAVCEENGATAVLEFSLESLNLVSPVIRFGWVPKHQGPECKHRPGHFDGVCFAIYRHLKIVQPDVSYFGVKDYEQLLLARSLVDELQMNVDIEALETARDESGLALSSRNVRLDASSKMVAPAMFRHMRGVVSLIADGGDHASALAAAKSALEAEVSDCFGVEYFELRDARDLSALTASTESAVLLCCISNSTVRLIDSCVFAVKKALVA